MAIRMDHPLMAIGGLAAYSAGRGRAKERTLRYTLDVMEQKNRERARQAALEQQRNMFIQNRLWDEADTAQKRKWDEADAEQQRKWELEDRTAEDTRRMHETRAELLPPIPKELDDPATRRDLEAKRAAIKDMLTSGRFDLTRPEVMKKVEEEIASYENAIKNLTFPSEAEKLNRGLTYADPKTGKHSDVYFEGAIPMQGDRPAPAYMFSMEAEAKSKAEKAAAEKEAANEQKKIQEGIRKAATDRMKDEDFIDANEKLSPEERWNKAVEEVTPRFAAGAAGDAGGGDVPEVVIGDDGMPTEPMAPKAADKSVPMPSPSLPPGGDKAVPMPSPGTALAPPSTEPAPPTIPITVGSPTSIDPNMWGRAKGMAMEEEAASRVVPAPVMPYDEAWRRAKAMSREDETAYARDMARKNLEYKAGLANKQYARGQAVTAKAQAKSAARKYRLGKVQEAEELLRQLRGF